MQIKTFLLSVLMVLSLTHCASYDLSRRVVQQGNLLPSSKIEQLKIGMNKEDVAILMGTSLLSPLFSNDRWDYAYTLRKGNSPMLVKNLSLYFKNNQLVRIERNPN
jgi:outer membrane protein assembly factor BamE